MKKRESSSSKDTIPLFVAINEAYVIHMLTMLTSLLQNNKGLINELFVLSAVKLSLYNRIKIQSFCFFMGIRTNFVVIPGHDLVFKNEIHGHVGVESFLRLYIPYVCPKKYKNALYLDCDLIVNGRLYDFFDIDSERADDFIIIAVEELGESMDSHKKTLNKVKYFNAGVLNINIVNWQSNFSHKIVKEWINNFNSEKHIFHDQDILNINIQEFRTVFKGQEFNYTNHNKNNLKIDEPVIIHFTGSGSNKPWSKNCRNPYRHLYWKYRNRIDPIGVILHKITLRIR